MRALELSSAQACFAAWFALQKFGLGPLDGPAQGFKWNDGGVGDDHPDDHQNPAASARFATVTPQD